MTIKLHYDGETGTDNTDKRQFKLIRLRANRDCIVCDITIPTGSYCIGGNWCKLCIGCFLEKTIKNYKKEIESLKSLVSETEKYVLKNKDKILQHNVLKAI